MAGKSKGIVIGILIVFVLKLVMYAFKITTKVLAHIIVYFGLYIPFFYCIFGLVLYGAFDFNFNAAGANAALFFSGLGLSLLCALIITVRNLIVRPIKSAFAYTEQTNRPTYREEERRYFERRGYPSARRYYGSAPRETQREEADGYMRREYEPDDRRMPTIYYSEREPDLLIYEYEDRFEVFVDNGSMPKRYLRTEYK